MRYTTLNEIWKHDPCGKQTGSKKGWDLLLTNLGKTEADDEPLSFLAIIDGNGVDDCLWAARADTADDADRFWRLLACDFVEHLQPADADPRSLNAIAVARKYAVGEADADELAAAWGAAWGAASEARAAETAWQEARLRELLSKMEDEVSHDERRTGSAPMVLARN